MTARIVSVEEARRVLEQAEQALADPYAPHRTVVLEHERHLWRCNPDARASQVAEALDRFVAQETAKNRAFAERMAAQHERDRLHNLCKRCGERPGSTRTVLGPPGLKDQIWHGWAVTVKLCPECAAGVEYALGQAAYSSDPDSYNDFAARLLSGDRTGLT